MSNYFIQISYSNDLFISIDRDIDTIFPLQSSNLYFTNLPYTWAVLWLFSASPHVYSTVLITTGKIK